ncbi:hypothetical protein [Nodularia sphaerocarpa]|uniref:hypothetical protein n=1 Tax=Nodularia sphaerocarpa TaxID=137816 RepID=UPI001EFA5A83|nr:hypothetical protein [Nodularia sphaerocarpa]MDB9374208.1 hypothetical protein [Nodularia sphaerocarpa CS-585]MDB9380511.1 hypothetical protein [Nodularia sphaerocarpa CS-585A2]
MTKIFQNITILTELERHQTAHLEKLSTYKNLEEQYFQNPQDLTETAKFQYLTLLNGISYETHWINWCDLAIQLMKPTSGKCSNM